MALQPPVLPGPVPMGGPPRPMSAGPLPAGVVPPGAVPPGAKAPGAPGAKAPGAAPAPGEEEHEHYPQIGFLQKPWVQNVLPFVTSLLIHAIIVVIGIVAFMVVKQVVPHLLTQEQITVPEAQLSDSNPGGIPNVGMDNDPLTKAMQNTTPNDTKPDGVASKAGLVLQPAGAQGDTSSDVIATGPGQLLGGPGGNTHGNGTGDGSGPLAQYGLRSGGGAQGPHGPVFGYGGNARRIVFICDATGSMLQKMAALKQQLQNTVDELKPTQFFNIVFYYDGPKVQALSSTPGPNGLLPGNAENRRKALQFLDAVTPIGQTDPFPAMDLAFSQQPQLVYLLSDGGLDDNLRTNDEVLKKVAQLETAANHKVRINTIMFFDRDEEGVKVMTKIADDDGGKFKYVKESDLDQ